MASGWTGIESLIDSGDDVEAKLTNAFTNIDSDVAALDTRIDSLELSHTVLLSAVSAATAQTPTGTDTPLQVEFGPLQTTEHIDLAADGSFTFNTTGRFILSPIFQYGREGSTGTAILLHRLLINGVQFGSTLCAKIDNADMLTPWSSSIIIPVTAGDVMTMEIMRDSSGNDSGGLIAVDPTVAGWAVAPTASIQIYKVN